MKLKSSPRQTRWVDRTLSVLRASRLEACQKELEGLGGYGLFDAQTTDADAERLFEQSYFAQEDREKRLHTINELRQRVLSQFPAEVGLLSPEERELVMKIIVLGGKIPLRDWNDLFPALSLVRRMWCRMIPDKGLWIRLSRQICVGFLLMYGGEESGAVRQIADEVVDAVDQTLYLAGMLSADVVMEDMAFRLQGTLAADKPELYMRLLKSSFETCFTREGRRMLVHPGMAEPWNWLSGMNAGGGALGQGDVALLYSSLMDVEDPLYDQMMGQIQLLCRPEISPEDTVEDLILLAKQGAAVEDMRRVLGTKLICLPTPEMVEVLTEMRARVPRWSGLNMERVQ